MKRPSERFSTIRCHQWLRMNPSTSLVTPSCQVAILQLPEDCSEEEVEAAVAKLTTALHERKYPAADGDTYETLSEYVASLKSMGLTDLEVEHVSSTDLITLNLDQLVSESRRSASVGSALCRTSAAPMTP